MPRGFGSENTGRQQESHPESEIGFDMPEQYTRIRRLSTLSPRRAGRHQAEVVKLVDTLASGASGGNPVEVQVLSSAPIKEGSQWEPFFVSRSDCRPAPGRDGRYPIAALAQKAVLFALSSAPIKEGSQWEPFLFVKTGTGDWGLGTGDWGLGSRDSGGLRPVREQARSYSK